MRLTLRRTEVGQSISFSTISSFDIPIAQGTAKRSHPLQQEANARIQS